MYLHKLLCVGRLQMWCASTNCTPHGRPSSTFAHALRRAAAAGCSLALMLYYTNHGQVRRPGNCAQSRHPVCPGLDGVTERD